MFFTKVFFRTKPPFNSHIKFNSNPGQTRPYPELQPMGQKKTVASPLQKAAETQLTLTYHNEANQGIAEIKADILFHNGQRYPDSTDDKGQIIINNPPNVDYSVYYYQAVNQQQAKQQSHWQQHNNHNLEQSQGNDWQLTVVNHGQANQNLTTRRYLPEIYKTNNYNYFIVNTTGMKYKLKAFNLDDLLFFDITQGFETSHLNKKSARVKKRATIVAKLNALSNKATLILAKSILIRELEKLKTEIEDTTEVNDMTLIEVSYFLWPDPNSDNIYIELDYITIIKIDNLFIKQAPKAVDKSDFRSLIKAALAQPKLLNSPPSHNHTREYLYIWVEIKSRFITRASRTRTC